MVARKRGCISKEEGWVRGKDCYEWVKGKEEEVSMGGERGEVGDMGVRGANGGAKERENR